VQFFNICFMIECAAKIVAYGFIVGPFTYLKDTWNWLDFFIVILGVLDFLPSDGEGASNLSSLRSLRVMRPLRAVTKFPELRFLIVLLLQCIPMLSNVLGLCSFIFLVFGILGVQLFQGLLRGQCYSFEDGSVHDPVPCSLESNGGLSRCPNGYECLLLGENPEAGIVHFDGIGGALMSIFQVMTLEGWLVSPSHSLSLPCMYGLSHCSLHIFLHRGRCSTQSPHKDTHTYAYTYDLFDQIPTFLTFFFFSPGAGTT
jgi:voltage-dependent calcium channel L type alpha-1D